MIFGENIAMVSASDWDGQDDVMCDGVTFHLVCANVNVENE